MARKAWIPVTFEDVATPGYLNFLLREVRKLKLLAYEKGTTQEGADALVREFMHGRAVLQNVPRFIFDEGLKDLLGEKRPKLQSKTHWNSVYLPLREGWVKEREKRSKSITWAEYNQGIRHKMLEPDDVRVVTPEKAEIDLFEKGILRWKWGTLYLAGNVSLVLERQWGEKGHTWENGVGFFTKVKRIEVAKVASRKEESWKVFFDLE